MGALADLSAWLGGGVDAVHVQPRQGQLGVATLTKAHWTAVTVLRAELRATVLLGRRLGLSLASSVEWDPVKRHYDVSGLDGAATIVQPYTVRPGLSLALEWP
jgi:cytolysin (calcineurin-like family phosphatase)